MPKQYYRVGYRTKIFYQISQTRIPGNIWHNLATWEAQYCNHVLKAHQSIDIQPLSSYIDIRKRDKERNIHGVTERDRERETEREKDRERQRETERDRKRYTLYK